MAISRNYAISTLVLGICELVCGILIIALAVAAANKADISSGLSSWWAGLIFAIPGIVGIAVGITKNNGAMIAFMVLNIIAFVLQGIVAIIAAIAIALWSSVISDSTDNCHRTGYKECYCSKGDNNFTIKGVENCDEVSDLLKIISALLVFLVIAAIIALTGSIIGCVVLCCQRQPAAGVILQPAPGVVYQQQTTANTQQEQPPPYYQPEPTKQ